MNPLEQILHNFIKADMKQARIQGIQEIVKEMMEDIAKDNNLPVEVFERRNVIYFRRTDMDE